MAAIALWCCCNTLVFAQNNPIDQYLSKPFSSEIIARSTERLSSPQDLDFCKSPGRENELWVLCKGDANGGFTVTFFDPGTPTQKYQYRRDSHASHFMRSASAIAMADNGNFGTSPEILNTVGSQTSTFMGPTLWNSDTSVYARINQNNWVNGEPLGSHSDMLHQSPYSMGIASDTGDVYWVFDGYHGYIYRYDFEMPHPYGGDDHSDGIIHRMNVKVKRVANLPSHMVLDQQSGWLFVVDNGNKRIIRIDTRSGTVGDEIFTNNETLQEYLQIDNVTWETIDSGLSRPCGIDYFDGRLITSDNGTGEIRVYNTTTEKPTYLGSINTGDAGIMGLKIGPDSAIWYVNKTKNQLVRLSTSAPSLVRDIHPQSNFIASILPNPAANELTITLTDPSIHFTIIDALGREVAFVNSSDKIFMLDVRTYPNGIYYCVAKNGSAQVRQFIVCH